MALYSPRAPQTLVVLPGADTRRFGLADGGDAAEGDGGGDDGGGDAPVTGASDLDTSPDDDVILRSCALLVLAYVLAVVLSALVFDEGELEPTAVGAGFGVFALFYVFAQTIERLLEPLSKSILPTAAQVAARDLAVRKARNNPKDDEAANAAAQAKAVLEHRRANRSLAFWAIATAAGFLAAASMKGYFLSAVGVGSTERWAEILVSGAVIGAGTKPLHDLITRIEKKKEETQDPPDG